MRSRWRVWWTRAYPRILYYGPAGGWTVLFTIIGIGNAVGGNWTAAVTDVAVISAAWSMHQARRTDFNAGWIRGNAEAWLDARRMLAGSRTTTWMARETATGDMVPKPWSQFEDWSHDLREPGEGK